MKAEILAVGTELLLGNIVNTDAQYISRRLADMGIFVYYQSVVGDNADRLRKAYELAFSRSDIVITTGGLGPTEDDLTKETACKYFNKKLVLDETSLERITEYFKKSGRGMTEGNRKQAYMPEGCIIVQNNHGTAPGCIMEENGKILILMPGPPKEVQPMFEESIAPYLMKYQKNVLVSKVLRIFGIGEGHMAEKIKDIIDNQTNPTVAPYVKEDDVTLRITAQASNEDEGKKLIASVEEKIRSKIGEFVYAEGETSLEAVVGKTLIEKKLTISTAESCTGGLLAGKLINFPGISSVFMEGAVTYTNEAKMKRLGVKSETLKNFGAVSSETAGEMAKGIASRANTDIGISTTGIAGPGGGTDEKPVGLVYVGLYIDGKVKTKKLNLVGDRQKIRNKAVLEALNFLRIELKNTLSC